MNTKHILKPIAATLALLLFGGVPLVERTLSSYDVNLGASAAAASESKGKGGAGGHGGAGKSGGSGGTGGSQHKGGKTGSATTSSTGGTTSDTGDEDSDKRGPKYMGGENANKPGDGVRGGKPAWAQEGIPEGVELGRLNVARAPEHVLERQYLEALNTWVSGMTTLYTLSAEDAAKLLESDYDNVLRYDSPLMNLALYKDLVIDGVSGLPIPPPTYPATSDLAAIFLGAASDKTVAITVDTVKAINLILDLNMTDADAQTIAIKAEDVREAIYTGHE